MVARALGVAATALILSAVLALASGPPIPDVAPRVPPRHPLRVVSIGLHQDEIALALAPDRVVALDAFADDVDASFVVAEARSIAGRVTPSTESILSHRPDLVLLPGWVDRELEASIVRAGVAVHREPVAMTLESIRASLLRLGALLDAEERASALLAELDRAIAALPPPPAAAPTVMLLAATGTTPGTETLFAELVERAGGRIALARPGIMPLSLELLLTIDPEVIFVDGYVADGRARTLGGASGVPETLLPHLRAARTDRIHPLSARLANTTSHHVAETLRALSAHLRADGS